MWKHISSFDTSTTEFFQSKIGVQQGAITSPLLFALYLNEKLFLDLNEKLKDKDGVYVNGKSIKILMYADDIVIVSNSVRGLQNHLDNLYDYFNMWKLNVNLNKTRSYGTPCHRQDHIFLHLWFAGCLNNPPWENIWYGVPWDVKETLALTLWFDHSP